MTFQKQVLPADQIYSHTNSIRERPSIPCLDNTRLETHNKVVSKNLSVLTLFTSFIAIFVLVVAPSFAANLALTRIGALDLNDSNYSEWWYTGTNPTLYGTADQNATVTITVDSTANEITADASGNWSHTPSMLTSEDHNISISSNGETITFLLHVGKSIPTNVGEAQIAEPETAINLSPMPDPTAEPTTTTPTTTKGGQTTEVPVTGLLDNQIYAYIAIALGLILGGVVVAKVNS